MKLGLGLYRHLLTRDNFRFAKQAACTHLVVHLVDYFNNLDGLPSTDKRNNWGIAKARDAVWEYENLVALRKAIEAEGLILEAIENFSPADWHDILLDGPKKREQLEYLKQVVRNVDMKAAIDMVNREGF